MSTSHGPIGTKEDFAGAYALGREFGPNAQLADPQVDLSGEAIPTCIGEPGGWIGE